jgi:hypothetical protein
MAKCSFLMMATREKNSRDLPRLVFFSLSFLVTGGLTLVSWNLVEKRALRFNPLLGALL